MFGTYELSGRVPRVRANRLALCLSAVLVSQFPVELALAASAAATLPLPRATAGHHTVPAKSNPDHPAVSPWTVKNCTDHDADSLRDIIQHKAASGDTVDLSQLPMLCNAKDSKITLTNGEIPITQNDLTLRGPDAGAGTVTVSGGSASRVLHHEGMGTLALYTLTIADGYYQGDGGCIESNGSVHISSTVVTNCLSKNGNGGGIYAAADATMILSTISGNEAANRGGGACADTLTAKYSSISGNTAGRGGGIRTFDAATIVATTVDHNNAFSSAGLYVDGNAYISNSTISGNVAAWTAALRARSDIAISNSTIAFNHSDYGLGDGSGAVELRGLYSNELTLQSSIIADNTSGADSTPADLSLRIGSGRLSASSADNLVIASNLGALPPGIITVTADPKLGPLQFNGGMTQTHALLPGSPALGMGNNTAMRVSDQRGNGYPRTTGPTQTVDIGAFQFDTIFVGGFDTQ